MSVETPPLGDLWTTLPFIRDGWKYKLDIRGRLSSLLGGTNTETINLIRGGGRYKFKYDYTLLEEEREARAWFLVLDVIFSNPFGTARYTLDKWSFEASPYLVKMYNLHPAQTFNFRAFCDMYDPMTAYGPMYSVVLDPSEPIPAATDFDWEFYLPASSIAASCEVLLALIGRVVVNDYKSFLKEYRKFTEDLRGANDVRGRS